jgi:hypothetical protein
MNLSVPEKGGENDEKKVDHSGHAVIIPAMLFTVSCAKKAVVAEPA